MAVFPTSVIAPVVGIAATPGALSALLIFDVVGITQTLGTLPAFSSLALARYVGAIGLSGGLGSGLVDPIACCASPRFHTAFPVLELCRECHESKTTQNFGDRPKVRYRQQSTRHMGKATYQVDYPRVSAVVKKKYAIWMDTYAEIESRCRQAQHGQTLRIDGQHHLLIMVLFARTVSNTAAAMLVAEHGYNIQCKSLLRTALESMFVLAAITKDSALAEAYVQSGEREIKRKVNKTRFWSAGLRSTVQSRFASEGFKASSRTAKSTMAKSLSIEDMAKVAGLHDWYLTAYSVFSDAVHGNIHDLEHHFIRGEDDEIQAIRSGAMVDDLEGLYLCACEILLKGLEVMDETFQIDSRDFRERMLGRLAEAVKAMRA